MAEQIVMNTGPLIALSRMGCLDLVGRLPYEIICPMQVREELDEGEASGYPRIDPPWLKAKHVQSSERLLITTALDRGEAAVILLALELDIRIVSIDEWKGRRAAQAAQLMVTGSLGLLAKCKLLGLIPHLRPMVDIALEQGIRYHPDVVRKVLEAVGE